MYTTTWTYPSCFMVPQYRSDGVSGTWRRNKDPDTKGRIHIASLPVREREASYDREHDSLDLLFLRIGMVLAKRSCERKTALRHMFNMHKASGSKKTLEHLLRHKKVQVS